jgi:hypothetical protein
MEPLIFKGLATVPDDIDKCFNRREILKGFLEFIPTLK